MTEQEKITAKYNRNARQKASGVFSALLKREFSRFTASPAYMLNCGFGVIIMPIAGILLLFRGAALRSMLFELFDSNTGTIAILAAAAVCLVSTMNDMTAPSVSLEGKTLWILRPVKVAAANRHCCAQLPACRHQARASPGESLPGTATGSTTSHPGKHSALQESVSYSRMH